MNLFLLFFRQSRWQLIGSAAAGVVSGLCTTALVATINAELRYAPHWPAYLLWTFVLLCILRLITGVGAHILLVRLSQHAIYDLRMSLCHQVLAAPLPQIEAMGATRLMTSLAEDMQQVGTIVINLPYLFVNLVILAGCFLYMGWLSWPTLLGISVCMAVGALSYLGAVMHANTLLRQARKQQDHLFGHFRALVDGAKELKLHDDRRQSFVSQALIPNARDILKHHIRGITLYSAAANWGRLLFFVYVGILLFAGARLLGLSTVSLAALMVVILYMMAPLEATMNSLPHVAQADVALRQLESIRSSLPDEFAVVPNAPLNVPETWAHLTLSSVTYSYQHDDSGQSFVLGPIDLHIQRPGITFLAGGNGSGKTTLAKLITGLYVPDSGILAIDRHAIAPHNRRSYRQFFSTVFNDFYLFDHLYGINVNSDKITECYLQAFRLQGVVRINDGRLSTTENLSTGQRKRLALLVALLEDRPALVLDEWAADQDPAFRRYFYERLLPELKNQGKAVIAITHDDRYFGVADHIVRLEEGRQVADFTETVQAHSFPSRSTVAVSLIKSGKGRMV